jgi:hypothetical protein
LEGWSTSSPSTWDEDLRALTFSFINIMTQLAGGEPLSSDILTQGASTAFPYGLRSAAQIVEHHMARCFCPPPVNEEFVGMANYIAESIHDLTSDLESISDSISS